jgi:hypothetical protein
VRTALTMTASRSEYPAILFLLDSSLSTALYT